MQKTDRGNYKAHGSFGQVFMRSCLGKITILVAVFVTLLIIAHISVPDEQTMMTEMDDNIRQCIETNDSIKTDWIDDAVNNIGYIFTHADSIPNKEIIDNFYEYNTMKFYQHPFYSTVLLHNNFKPEGIRIGIGIFGIVIPKVSFKDFLFKIGPMHKGYDQKPVKATITVGGSSFGNDPELGL
jgi:hypothetical protein